MNPLTISIATQSSRTRAFRNVSVEQDGICLTSRACSSLVSAMSAAKAFRADDTVVEDSSVAEAQDAFAQWKSLHKVS